ncbi:MAG: SDR family NAD(P)-dependent oxidoreductase [Mycobacteriales bacterium]
MNANEVVLVTGGNKGIGREIVRQLAERGFTVYLGPRDPERGRSAVDELMSRSASVIRFVRLDVTDVASVRTAVTTTEAATERLDMLVNNAGITVEWGVWTAEVTAAHLREMYEVNVFGILTVTSACLPLLRQPADRQHVQRTRVTHPAERPRQPLPAQNFLAYGSPKATLNALTPIYAKALPAGGITVNAASPGLLQDNCNLSVGHCSHPRARRRPHRRARTVNQLRPGP